MAIINKKIDEDPEFQVEEELQNKRKDIKTFDDLTAFLKDVSDNYNIGYGSCVRAISQAILATAHYFSNQFGITGFQASCITWGFIHGWTDVGKKTSARLIDYDKMLYPQYEKDFENIKVLPQHVWDGIQKAANDLLSDTTTASDNVINHWKSIADGNVPFGYTVGPD